MNKDKTQNNDKTPKNKLLLNAFEEQVNIKIDLGRERTAKNYRTTIAKIKTYLSEQSDSDSNNRNGNDSDRTPLSALCLCNIDTQWVQDFTAWLYRQHPDTPGTAGFYPFLGDDGVTYHCYVYENVESAAPYSLIVEGYNTASGQPLFYMGELKPDGKSTIQRNHIYNIETTVKTRSIIMSGGRLF